ncbi:MAG: hypothetical protein K6G17_02455 [Oscillospiraceae bacterium]|nr:hypothetical protein [Oscillospiraceae bacterium]
MNRKARSFLEKHGMNPDRVDPEGEARKISQTMERGLLGPCDSMPMIPTFLRTDRELPHGSCAVVIDAGGTNFRAGLVRFLPEGYRLEHLVKKPMPGIAEPATWEEFIRFTADAIEPFVNETDEIGFCFSYSAVITPEIDGRVIRIDKEVVVTGSEGRLVGRSLCEELARRGITGKHVVILNDSAAVLLGGLSGLDRSAVGGLIGQVSGTGSNTCCVLPMRRAAKLGRDEDTPIIINMESGLYDGLPRGDFDCALDAESHNPGLKFFEKMTAGVYLGELARLMLEKAYEEGLLSTETMEGVRRAGHFDAALLDAWALGEHEEGICSCAEDAAFISDIAGALFERSARSMCAMLAGIALTTGEGRDPLRPVVVCAEGSLVQKGRVYRPILEELLKTEALAKLGLSIVLRVGEETTLPGAAAAALLNR